MPVPLKQITAMPLFLKIGNKACVAVSGLLWASLLNIRLMKMREIEKALQLDTETNVILKLGEIIWRKTEKGDDSFSNLTEAEKVFIYVDMLEGQVNNGRFDQFFFNSSGDYAHEILTAYKQIKAYNTMEIIKNAIDLFPVLPVPKDTEARRQIMKDIDESISDQWDKLDNRFYLYEDNIAKLLIDYIKENIDSVGE